MKEPYSDDPSTSGIRLTSEAELAELVQQADASGLQVWELKTLSANGVLAVVATSPCCVKSVSVSGSLAQGIGAFHESKNLCFHALLYECKMCQACILSEAQNRLPMGLLDWQLHTHWRALCSLLRIVLLTP